MKQFYSLHVSAPGSPPYGSFFDSLRRKMRLCGRSADLERVFRRVRDRRVFEFSTPENLEAQIARQVSAFIALERDAAEVVAGALSIARGEK